MTQMTFTVTIKGEANQEALSEIYSDDESQLKEDMRQYIEATLSSNMSYDGVGTTCVVE